MRNAEDKIISEKKHNLITEVMRFIYLNDSNILKCICNSLDKVEEIRLRAEKPIMLSTSSKDWCIDINGNLTDVEPPKNLYIISQDEIVKSLQLMSRNSIYAFQEDIRNGFITLKGGHRVGICGRAVNDGNQIKNVKDFSGLNIRISKEVPNCSRDVLNYIINKDTVFNTLIISPPQCGKTTILRDITKHISNGIGSKGFQGLKVGIVDERSEIAACYNGVAQNDIGLRTDVMDGCRKTEGMLIMLRSMSPQVIVTDEIGNKGDYEAVKQVINAGVKIITSAHGYNISELNTRKEVLELIESRIFERYIVLSSSNGPGTVEEIIDGNTMNLLYRRNRNAC